jgi:K+-sensing histidine kinase KdpD
MPRAASLQARFLSVISHELRTPLTTIASFTESLDADDLAPAERSVALSAVRRNIDRMLTLLDDLMVVSRLQTGDLELAPATVDLDGAVREAAETLSAQEPHTATTIRAGDGSRLTADPAMLRTLVYAVLGTVATGAADRTVDVSTATGPENSTITAVARQAEELTDEHLMAGMLAEPDPPHRRRSTALWMLLAEAIATRHGGSVELTYDPDTGAGAVVVLPTVIPTA